MIRRWRVCWMGGQQTKDKHCSSSRPVEERDPLWSGLFAQAGKSGLYCLVQPTPILGASPVDAQDRGWLFFVDATYAHK
jgi:hypothetical protein